MSDIKRIMIIDDDPNHLVTAREILEAEGYRVEIHETAFGATHKVKESAPDLVLIDMNMPALSGEGLASLLKQKVNPDQTGIVFYSSNDVDSLRRAVVTHGVTGYIAKGDPLELRNKVGFYLQAKGGGQEPTA